MRGRPGVQEFHKCHYSNNLFIYRTTLFKIPYFVSGSTWARVLKIYLWSGYIHTAAVMVIGLYL